MVDEVRDEEQLHLICCFEWASQLLLFLFLLPEDGIKK
jgi:hypothetical protein